MKLKWDISCPTYIEFLPFIYDILDSSLQEDIGKGNQVRFRSVSGLVTVIYGPLCSATRMTMNLGGKLTVKCPTFLSGI